MVSKIDPEKLGFKINQSVPIIRQVKIKMVNAGYPYYNNKRGEGGYLGT
ncbi:MULTISPECIES: DUF3173 family protein [Listeria]